MSQVTSGLRSILSIPFFYSLCRDVLTKNTGDQFVVDYIAAKDDDLVLDIGCGVGNMLDKLPHVKNYYGVDLSEEYIKQARGKFRSRGTFIHGDVSQFNFEKVGSPDIVLLIGVLHHLNDKEVIDVFKAISKIKKTSTRVITLDGCYTDSQGMIARKFISMDRGQNVRTPEAYKDLISPWCRDVKETIVSDLIRIPYTHCFLEIKY